MAIVIKPLADRIVVRIEEKKEEEHASGILLPSSSTVSRHKEGVVVAIGRGRMADPTTADVAGMNANHFAFYPMEVKIGDRVVFSFGEEYTIRGEKVYIMKESDILAILE